MFFFVGIVKKMVLPKYMMNLPIAVLYILCQSSSSSSSSLSFNIGWEEFCCQSSLNS